MLKENLYLLRDLDRSMFQYKQVVHQQKEITFQQQIQI